MGDSIAGSGATIMDLTAGFGQDSMMMALGGASKVTMVERDPIVSLLLDDALRRLKLLSEQNDTNLIDDESRKRASDLFSKLDLQKEENGINIAKHIAKRSSLSDDKKITQ